jgi:hypothetical protein
MFNLHPPKSFPLSKGDEGDFMIYGFHLFSSAFISGFLFVDFILNSAATLHERHDALRHVRS